MRAEGLLYRNMQCEQKNVRTRAHAHIVIRGLSASKCLHGHVEREHVKKIQWTQTVDLHPDRSRKTRPQSLQ